MKTLSHLHSADQLPQVEAGHSHPQQGMIAALYVANVLGGGKPELVNQVKIQDLKSENGHWVMKVGDPSTGQWGDGAVDVLVESGCEAHLLNPEVSEDYALADYISVRIPAFLVTRIEQIYARDIAVISERIKKKTDSVLEEAETDDGNAAADEETNVAA